MTRRDVVRLVFDGKRPPYVPWDFKFTAEARATLAEHFGADALDDVLGNHIHWLRCQGPVDWPEPDRMRDCFGVVWDRSVDKDIGVVTGQVLPEPTLAGYTFPDPLQAYDFAGIPAEIHAHADQWLALRIGYSLYERAWSLRGMETLMMDFYDHPEFVRELLHAIADYNVAQVEAACRHDVDAVYFGDDWGQQTGLQMSPATWREFILPELKRMYAAVRKTGKRVMIHSCGKVDELFDDLLAVGLDCFNPFQPEVMDVEALLARYRGRLVFHGGLSTQQTLPYGTADDVRAESRRLLQLGAAGGYIFAPAHAVEGDVPLENMLAFIEAARSQT